VVNCEVGPIGTRVSPLLALQGNACRTPCGLVRLLGTTSTRGIDHDGNSVEPVRHFNPRGGTDPLWAVCSVVPGMLGFGNNNVTARPEMSIKNHMHDTITIKIQLHIVVTL
jgi:hypothetical protein